MTMRKAELTSFDSGGYTASVRIDGGYKVNLDGIAVARNLDAGEMTAGRSVAVLFFDDHVPRDAVIIAVYTP